MPSVNYCVSCGCWSGVPIRRRMTSAAWRSPISRTWAYTLSVVEALRCRADRRRCARQLRRSGAPSRRSGAGRAGARRRCLQRGQVPEPATAGVRVPRDSSLERPEHEGLLTAGWSRDQAARLAGSVVHKSCTTCASRATRRPSASLCPSRPDRRSGHEARRTVIDCRRGRRRAIAERRARSGGRLWPLRRPGSSGIRLISFARSRRAAT